jgi:hypothetical protein
MLACNVSASAAIVCNDERECWKVKEKHTYLPNVKLHVYEDDYVIDTKKSRPTPGSRHLSLDQAE